MYTEGHKSDAPKLPDNLFDALNELAASKPLSDGLGSEFIASYLKLKKQQWTAYNQQVTDWERETTLDC